MRRHTKYLMACALGGLLTGGGWTAALAQYIVSARAGLVNYTQGEVFTGSRSETLIRRLAPHQHLDDGMNVFTEDGRAEILLNPGSVLRMDRDTEVIFHRTDLPLVELEISRGTILIEAGDVNREIIFHGQTPHGAFRIRRDGLYRIDVRPEATRLLVRKGEMEALSEGRIHKVKKNGQVTMTSDHVEVAKLSRPDPLDAFEQWAKDRAEILIAANRMISRRRLSDLGVLASVWIYDPFSGVFTFLPFGYDFRSPWGRTYRCFYPVGWYWTDPPYGGGTPGGSRGTAAPPTAAPREPKPSFRVGDLRPERGGVLMPGPAAGGRGGEMHPAPHPMPTPGGEVRPAPGPVKSPNHQE